VFIATLFSCSFKGKRSRFEIPPHTIKINDSLYIDKTPVPLEFMWEYYVDYRNTTKKQMMSYERSLSIVDSISHSTRFSKLKDFEQDRNILFLNADKKYATDYCKWRTDRVNEVFKIGRKISERILYRLPTTNELSKAEAHFNSLDKILYHQNDNLKISKANYQTEDYQVFNIGEYTENDSLFYSSKFKLSLNSHVGFRCICEIKQF
jgi:formylglycine-generating enzyme required for sulfatase activity